MPALRDHVGSGCPSCRKDILQPVPSHNRMPHETDAVWCPTCKARMTIDDLEGRRGKPGAGFLSRLFGGPQRS